MNGIAKLIRVQIVDQPAECVVAGYAFGRGEKAAQKWPLRLGERAMSTAP
jgi:hypothetical protein